MAVAAWGIAILVGYCLLQVPAVLLIARYCEVDAADLPTPPMRAFWTEEASSDDSATAGNEVQVAGAAPTTDEDRVVGDVPTPDDAVPDTETAITRDGVRCERCGAQNDPSFTRCRNCVAPM